MCQVERLPIRLRYDECHSGQVAGVKRIVMVSPPGETGDLPAGVLVAAKEAG